MTFYYPLPEKIVKSKAAEYDCEKCKLYNRKGLSNPYFYPTIGEKYNGLVILGQSPSKDDDQKSRPFVNKRAQVIRSIAYKNGINLTKEGVFLYALSCSVGKGKGTPVQYKCCRPILAEHLNELKPKMIICCGEMAFKSLFNLKNKIAATKLRGRVVPNYEFNCMVFTILNPNDIFRGDQEYAMRKDMERAIDLWKKRYNNRKKVDSELEKKKILDGITITEVKDPLHLGRVFDWVSNLKEVSVDYETTNTKPYDKWFDITHISFSNEKQAYVINESLWLKFPVWRNIKSFMKSLLENHSIHKIIQNDKFEELCSRYKFNIKRINNSDCPMLATHVIDERRGCTSLDFQNITRFGIPPYSDTIKSYLQKKNKDDKQNHIREAPYDDLIQYAGLDVITTYYNWKFLDEIIIPNSYEKARENYKFIHDGHRLFANMTHRGVKAGINELNELEETFKDNIQDVLERISNLPEFIEYNNYLGNQLNTKKEGDSKLKKFMATIKENTNGDDLLTNGIEKEKVTIRRKLQF
jgi:uracil-DNA glycosylase family 4